MSEAQTTGLADFLLARIAEDEAVARAASPGGWRYMGYGGGERTPATFVVTDAPDRRTQKVVAVLMDDSEPSGWGNLNREYDFAHIARHDPARVLAECEAKRRIVEWHKRWPVLVEAPPRLESSADAGAMTMRMTRQIMWTTEQEYRERFGSEPPTGPILRLLALPYADHPGYRDEWRPLDARRRPTRP